MNTAPTPVPAADELLECPACGYAATRRDSAWLHQEVTPLCVYECPECGDVVEIGPCPSFD